VLAHEPRAGAAKEASQHQRDEDGVVQLARDRDEVRDQVERKGEIHEGERRRNLPAGRNTRIAEEPLEQDGAVRHEPRDHPNVPLPSPDHERDDQRRVDRDEDDRGEEEPAHG
jgi:hypothetical protein